MAENIAKPVVGILITAMQTVVVRDQVEGIKKNPRLVNRICV
jgi:hypothetical protein